MLLVQFDRVDYPRALELQLALVELRLRGQGEDVLLLMEHPPTITLGARGNRSDLLESEEKLAALGIAVHGSDRGGMATFHGPGQIVAYPVVNLRNLGLSVRAYVHGLEETVLKTLTHFGLCGSRKADAIGIWTAVNDKIASIGVKIRNRIAYHGLSLNVDLHQDVAQLMICCGMPDARMVSINQFLDSPVSCAMVRAVLAGCFEEVFSVNVELREITDILNGMLASGLEGHRKVSSP